MQNLWEWYNDEFAAIVTPEGSYVYHVLQPVGDIIAQPYRDKPFIKETIGIPTWTPMVHASSIWVDLFKKKLEYLKAKKVGIEFLPFQIYEILVQKMTSVRFKSVFNDLLSIRLIKTEEEIRLLEYAAQVNDRSIEAGVDAVREGATTAEIVASINSEMWKGQIEAVSHLSAWTTSSLTPVGGAKLQKGDTVPMDTGVFVNGGYVADMARTGIVGTPAPGITEGLRVLKEAHLKGLNAIRPGAKASKVDRTIRETLSESGYPDVPYANGHGIGLRCMELPHIDKREAMVDDLELQTGMVVCLEPLTHVGDKPMKFEDTVVVEDSGRRILTKASYPV